ncbi:hypothetical protein GWQ27_19000 [Aeromonas sp. 5HA1]|nr:hypothetical protein [Aeromonas sp. 5HA1]
MALMFKETAVVYPGIVFIYLVYERFSSKRTLAYFFSNSCYFYFIFILLGVVLFSYISWHFFEKPVMHFSKNLLNKKNEKL